MGWTSTYVGKNRTREDLLKNEIFCGHSNNIDYYEIRGSNIWVIAHNENVRYAELFLTKYVDGEFYWKDISISMHPYYYNCGKKFVKMAKEIYNGVNKNNYADEWFKNWEKENEKNKNRNNLIKSLKVGDTIEFLTANYGGKKQWQVSHIEPKILFEGYNLRGWKKQEFKII